MTEGVNIVDDKVDAADTFKYDKIGKVIGKYYCFPGFSTATARRRALLQHASQCKPCGEDYYCACGFQTLNDPNRVACPEPTAGSNVLEFMTDDLTTASFRDQCLAVCATGYYAVDNVYGPCEICGYGYYCIGDVQRSLFQDSLLSSICGSSQNPILRRVGVIIAQPALGQGGQQGGVQPRQAMARVWAHVVGREGREMGQAKTLSMPVIQACAH